ncbi:MAG TPA: transcriptional regulator [Planctomycetaceae bacterium]|nr:transcriptional regulator [Planctomycetaceae bacterium]
MALRSVQTYQAWAKVAKALAHPARLMIVDELAEHGPRCVCELTELVGSDMSTVSRHLAQLRDAGLIESGKQGQMVFYRLRAPCVRGFFDCIQAVLEANWEQQGQCLR